MAQTRKRKNEAERLQYLESRYSSVAKEIYRIKQKKAQKELREKIQKGTPHAFAIRAVKSLLTANRLVTDQLAEVDTDFVDGLEEVTDILVDLLKATTGVDFSLAFKSRKPGTEDEDEDPDFEVKGAEEAASEEESATPVDGPAILA
jgi:hypothetical protein